MTINGKSMNEWLLEQVNKKEDEIHEKEDELHKRDESIQWIKWTVPVFVIIILSGFYFISEWKAGDTGRSDISSSTKTVESNRHVQPLDFSTVLGKLSADSRYSHIWGKENIKVTPQKELLIFYPKGSFSPSSEPRGWAGFIYKLDQPLDHARFSYKLKFEKNFDFVKGGKLPGFCSQDCPRGGTDVGNGFSTRFMWRKDGDIEGYLYIPGKEWAYGKSFGKGAFRFEAGRYYKVEQELQMNTPGKDDGTLIIYVDEKEVFRDDKIKFREGADTHIDSVIFSTFFWWSDGSFASSKDTYMYFKDFAVSY